MIRNKDYEFQLHKAYEDLQEHYGYVVIPARPLCPSDKSHVEAGVHRCEDWVISELNIHKDEFVTFQDIRKMCKELVDKMNTVEFRNTKRSRMDWFKDKDAPLLRPLPEKDFVIYRYHGVQVPTTYHVSIPSDRYRYSVPFQYIGQQVLLKYSFKQLYVYDHERQLIAEWQRSPEENTLHTTITNPEHRPPNHEIAVALGITMPEDYIRYAHNIGPNTEQFIKLLFARANNPEEMNRAAMGVITRAWKNSKDPIPAGLMETLCAELVAMNTISYSAFKSLLASKRLRQSQQAEKTGLPDHKNIRNKDTYK